MSAEQGTASEGLRIEVPGVGNAWIELTDAQAAERVRAAIESGARTLTLKLSDQDTEGHAMGGQAIAFVDVGLEGTDDVEGHALALRFPSPDDARRFRDRALATGVLAATIVVGGVGVASQMSSVNLPSDPAAIAGAGQGLSAEQIYVRGEVADRMGAGAAQGLSSEQIVVRGEVADRMAASAAQGLSSEQIYVRGEVADRMAAGAASTEGLSSEQIYVRGEVADRMAADAAQGLSSEQIVIRGEVADRMADDGKPEGER